MAMGSQPASLDSEPVLVSDPVLDVDRTDSYVNPIVQEAQEQAASDALYATFENDLNGPDGDGLNIADEVVAHEINAVSIAIIEGDKIRQYHQYGYRDQAKTLPANQYTTFSVASMSKFLAGLAMAEADRQGVLDLDRSMTSYAASYPNSTLDKWIDKKFKKDEEDYPDDITVDRLMSHTAGLDTHGIGIQVPPFVKTMDGIILGNILDPTNNGVQPLASPETIFDYSGGGFTVAEHVLELVTGESYTDWVTGNILDEVGTSNSTLETAHDNMTNLARGCSRGICIGSVPRTNVKAAGGFIATAEDYAKILRAVINDGFDDQGVRVIKKKVINKVLTATHHKDSSKLSCNTTSECPTVRQYCLPFIPCFDIPVEETCYQNQCLQLMDAWGGRYGYGVGLWGTLMDDGHHQIIEHGGSQDGYKTQFYVDRAQKRGIVILTAGAADWKKDGKTYGANKLKNEILSAFKRNYLGQ